MCDFRKRYNLSERTNESKRIMKKYPYRIPVIVYTTQKNMPAIDKSKFLVPTDLTVGQFLYVIRKRIQLAPEKALFLFCGNTLPQTSALCGSIYECNKDKDGFLYMIYTSENTFGSQ